MNKRQQSSFGNLVVTASLMGVACCPSVVVTLSLVSHSVRPRVLAAKFWSGRSQTGEKLLPYSWSRFSPDVIQVISTDDISYQGRTGGRQNPDITWPLMRLSNVLTAALIGALGLERLGKRWCHVIGFFIYSRWEANMQKVSHETCGR